MISHRRFVNPFPFPSRRNHRRFNAKSRRETRLRIIVVERSTDTFVQNKNTVFIFDKTRNMVKNLTFESFAALSMRKGLLREIS